jgi:hypothetical protein
MLHHKLRAAGGGLKTITKISDVISRSSTITVMSGVQSGDLLVFFDFAHNNGNGVPTAVTPSGFSVIHSHSGNYSYSDGRWSSYYKIANGTESGTTLTGMNSYTEEKCLILFRGDKQISSVSSMGIVSESDETSLNEPIITSSSGNSPFVIFAFFGIYAEDDGIGSSQVVATITGESMSTKIIYSNDENLSFAAWKIKNYGDTANNVTLDGYASGINSNYEIIGVIGFYLELK